jgi:uncharacterized membrane protein YhaH (DUF805 family)
MKWYFDALRQYAVFSGRSRRLAFWMFHLVDILLALLGFIVLRVLLSHESALVALGVYQLLTLLPNMALMVRRLHDIGRGGVWVLAVWLPAAVMISLQDVFTEELDPGTIFLGMAMGQPQWPGILLLVSILAFVVGGIILTVFAMLPGVRGANDFGDDPLRSRGDEHAFFAGGSGGMRTYED